MRGGTLQENKIWVRREYGHGGTPGQQKTINGISELGDASRLKGNRLVNNAYAGPVGWAFIDSHGDGHVIAGNVCEATSSSVGTKGHCYSRRVTG